MDFPDFELFFSQLSHHCPGKRLAIPYRTPWTKYLLNIIGHSVRLDLHWGPEKDFLTSNSFVQLAQRNLEDTTTSVLSLKHICPNFAWKPTISIKYKISLIRWIMITHCSRTFHTAESPRAGRERCRWAGRHRAWAWCWSCPWAEQEFKDQKSKIKD